MARVLTIDGSEKIGAYMLPGRKKPALCKEEGSKIIVYGHFNNIKSAENFMDELAKLVGAEPE